MEPHLVLNMTSNWLQEPPYSQLPLVSFVAWILPESIHSSAIWNAQRTWKNRKIKQWSPVKLCEQVFVTDVCKEFYNLQDREYKWSECAQCSEPTYEDNPLLLTVPCKGLCISTFSSVSSIASSLSFSLPPFFNRLSQNVARSSALVLPATPLLQKTSKASFKACKQNQLSMSVLLCSTINIKALLSGENKLQSRIHQDYNSTASEQ